jgi:acylphosphatase
MEKTSASAHLNIRVHGRVQGVFFRDSAEQEAVRLGLAGFVRNEPDGTVYIEAEGGAQALNRFLNWCRRGSRSAHPDRVEAEEDALQHFKSFSVRY